jgi:hypothetical protein
MPDTRRRSDGPRRGRRLPAEDASAPRFSPERAFVVQLEIRGAASRRALRGRVEHLVTGDARRFVSTAELVGFMSRFQRGEG